MSNTENARENEYVTTLTLRINFKTLTFKDSTKRERSVSRSSKSACSCATLHDDIHPYHSYMDMAQGLKPSDVVTARFVMTTSGNVEQAADLCASDIVPAFEHLYEFRSWMLSLAFLLAKLCEGDHSARNRERPPWGLRPFKDREVSKRTVCEEIRKLLLTPLNPTEKAGHGMGYIYVLRTTVGSSTVGALKIGFSKYHPEHRAHEIASCYALPEVVSHTPFIPHAKRVGSIIHAELQTIRKIHSCRKCKGNLQEWFTIMHDDSRETVKRWSRWILDQPYLKGHLTQEWKDYLANKKFESVDETVSLAKLWQSIIDEFPRDSSAGNESERIRIYLNQCHWDSICTQIDLDKLENIVKCDKCRQYASKWRNLKSSPFPKSEDEVDSAAERFVSMGLLDNPEEDPCDCNNLPDIRSELVSQILKQNIDSDLLLGTCVDKTTRECPDGTSGHSQKLHIRTGTFCRTFVALGIEAGKGGSISTGKRV